MSGNQTIDEPTAAAGRRERRRAETRAEIIDAAWQLAREEGLAGISMRELGARVGMRAQSLYGYVASKNDLYDAMFRQGYEVAGALVASWPAPPLTRAVLKDRLGAWIAFCVEDPVRYQLLFQRTIPDFEPSPASYALAVDVLAGLGEVLGAIGIDDPAAMDLLTAIVTGLTSQQLANDPGGDRWVRLAGEAVDMFLDHYGALPT